MENNEKSSYPVLWLLPPAGCDHTAWQRHTAVEDLADELGIIIVMPDLKLSYGLDMIHGFTYFQMLTKELPEMVADYFPADLGFQMIAGVKEGGYAALNAALSVPGQYHMQRLTAAVLLQMRLLTQNWISSWIMHLEPLIFAH